MKKCPKCGAEHNKSGIYCTRSCANSRKFSEASRRKKSEANKKYWDSLPEDEKKEKGLLLASFSPRSKPKFLESLMTQDWEVIGIQSKRLRVILEQNGRCYRCGIDNWLGETVVFEYEHKDGNKENNSRENVEALCPNCHSLTPTWKGRKNKGIRKSRSRQDQVEDYLKMKRSG